MRHLGEELAQIKDLLRTRPQGMSITEIASSLGKNKHSVGRYLDILHASGHVDLRTFGMAKVFTLSSRVPLQALLSYTSDIVLVLDRDMRIRQANEPFFSLTGLEQDRVMYQVIDQVPSPYEPVQDLLTHLRDLIHASREHVELILATEPPRYFRARTIPTVFEDGTNGITLILEDATGEQEALRSLRESEEFFRSLSDHLTDGLIVTEGDDLIFVNDRFFEITGYQAEDLEMLDPFCLPVPEERDRFIRTIEEASKNTGKIKEIRFWAYKKDKTPVYLYIRLSQIPFGDRIREYILFTDMTAWKIEEEQKNLQRTIMDRLMENFPHPFYIIDANGIFLMANNSFCNLIGHPGDEMNGRDIRDVLPGDMAENLTRGDRELVSDHTHIHVGRSVEFWKPDGKRGETWIEKSVVSAGEDNPKYIFGVFIDKVECLAICKQQITDITSGIEHDPGLNPR